MVARGQDLTTSVAPNPEASHVPMTIRETFCRGPRSLPISFYYGTDAGERPGHLIRTVKTKAGEYAAIQWTPGETGTYYLQAVSSDHVDCPERSSVLTQVVGKAPAYFGFYDSHSPDFPDETAATSTFANTVWIGCYKPEDCSSALDEAEKEHMKAIVAFRDPDLLPPGYTASQLESWKRSWIANWSKYVSTFGSYFLRHSIVAFFPYDEPFGSEWTKGNKAADTTAELNFVADVIHGTFKSSKVATTLTGPNTFTYFVHGQNILPARFDWIGIDIYGCWESCPDTQNVLIKPYTWYVSTLEANLYRNQKIILLPGTAIYYGGTYEQWQANVTASQWQPIVKSNAHYVQNILNLSVTDYTHIVGDFGFLYQTYHVPNRTIWVGAVDPSMAAILKVLTDFGKNIMQR